MINEIFPYSFSNTFSSNNIIGDNDLIFNFDENTLLLKKSEDDYEIPKKCDISYIDEKVRKNFLFTFNDVSCFLVWDIPINENSELIYKEINFFRTFRKTEIAWISVVAYQLMNWHANNKFCGKCGSLMIEKTDERAIVCPNCDTAIYPRISPAVIVAIIADDKILLAHNNNFPSEWYSLIAGYADIGESLEETVIREVKEEVGLDVFNIRYYKSQPWPVSGSIMIGFIAEADISQSIQVDEKEINKAAWFSRDNLPNHPTNISIAGEIIEKFEKGELL